LTKAFAADYLRLKLGAGVPLASVGRFSKAESRQQIRAKFKSCVMKIARRVVELAFFTNKRNIIACVREIEIRASASSSRVKFSRSSPAPAQINPLAHAARSRFIKRFQNLHNATSILNVARNTRISCRFRRTNRRAT
jgi:methionyl-tRNA synthetase